jgi:hypothetical protein
MEVIQQHGTCPNCRAVLTRNSITECPPDELALRLKSPELDKAVFSTKVFYRCFRKIFYHRSDIIHNASFVTSRILIDISKVVRIVSFYSDDSIDE